MMSMNWKQREKGESNRDKTCCYKMSVSVTHYTVSMITSHKDKCHPIIESGPKFDWMPINPIVENNKDAEHINSVMNDAKYDYIQEDNNRNLGYHSNYGGGK